MAEHYRTLSAVFPIILRDSGGVRQLAEETGIGREDIVLSRLMEFTYYQDNCRVEVWAGRLRSVVAVAGEENELLWVDAGGDFFDMTRFAGEGNIGHIVGKIKRLGDKLLK